MEERRIGLFVRTWKPESVKKPEPVPVVSKDEILERESGSPVARLYAANLIRPATIEEYIRWCKWNWPRSEDGGEWHRYSERSFNGSYSIDMWYMIEPFEIPKSYGANSFEMIVPRERWIRSCVPMRGNPYQNGAKYPDIGHNKLFTPTGLIGGPTWVGAFDHPWFHKRYPETIAKSKAERRLRDLESHC